MQPELSAAEAFVVRLFGQRSVVADASVKAMIEARIMVSSFGGCFGLSNAQTTTTP